MFEEIAQAITSQPWTFWLSLILEVATLAIAAAAYRRIRKLKPVAKSVSLTQGPTTEAAPVVESEIKSNPEGKNKDKSKKEPPEKKDESEKEIYVFT